MLVQQEIIYISNYLAFCNVGIVPGCCSSSTKPYERRFVVITTAQLGSKEDMEADCDVTHGQKTSSVLS